MRLKCTLALSLLFFNFVLTQNVIIAQKRAIGVDNLTDIEAKERIALVIGNADYTTDKLINPTNDAKDIAKALKSLNFNVTLKINTPQNEMENSIQLFGQRLYNNSVGLFYYSGHGIQYNGNNFLIPIGALPNMSTPDHLRYKTVNLGYILSVMKERTNGINIIFLDACRKNPFKNMYRGKHEGLTKVIDAEGVIICYSTSPGKVALDGNEKNSPYTKELLNQLKKPNVPIEIMLKRVRKNVKKSTDNKQTPWYEASIDGDFYFIKNSQINSKNNSENINMDQSIEVKSYNAGIKWHEPVTGMEFIYVPSGNFEPHCCRYADRKCEKNSVLIKNKINVGDFWISKTEVTLSNYNKFLKITGYKGSKSNYHTSWECNGLAKTTFVQDYTHPVACLTFNDSVEYTNWLTKINNNLYQFRLPTETEWEFACRSCGKEQKYCGGNDEEKYTWKFDYNNWNENSTHPVATKTGNDLGIYDMSGNVWEWCITKNESFIQLIRGGGWSWGAGYPTTEIRDAGHTSASFVYVEAGISRADIGFRIVRTK